MAVKDKNVGAVNIRPPARGKERTRFIQLKELATAEFASNRKAGQGPTSFTKLFVEMLEERYAEQLGEEKKDAARKSGEKAGAASLFG